jgi:hypothetical protein
MKTVNSPLTIAAIFIAVAFCGMQACKKSSGPSGPQPIGGFVSSDSVEPGSLVAYWPLDGSPNDTKGGMTGTASNITYTAGVRGQAYQGSANGYITFTPNSAIQGLQSFSVSLWFWQVAQPSGTPNDPEGMFMVADSNTNPDLIVEEEHYAPVSGDSVEIHQGTFFPTASQWNGWTMSMFDTNAIGKWVHFVMTYDGGSSTYVVYQNGQAMPNGSAYGTNSATVLLQGPANATPASVPQGNLNWTSVNANKPAVGTIGTWTPNTYGVSPTLGSNGCWMGKLDEIRVFDIAITQQDVAGLYLNGLAGR